MRWSLERRNGSACVGRCWRSSTVMTRSLGTGERRQDVVLDQLDRLLVHALRVVVGARDDRDRVEGRNHDDRVTSVAAHEPALHAGAGGLVDAMPEQIAI